MKLNWLQNILYKLGLLIIKEKEVIKKIYKEVPVVQYVDKPIVKEIVKEVYVENPLGVKYNTDFELNKNLIKKFNIQYGEDNIIFEITGVDNSKLNIVSYCIRNNKKYKVNLTADNFEVKYLKKYNYELSSKS